MNQLQLQLSVIEKLQAKVLNFLILMISLTLLFFLEAEK